MLLVQHKILKSVSSSCLVVGDEFLVQERFARLPLKMDAPERVLCQSHGQARPIADFLNENGDSFLTYKLLLLVVLVSLLPLLVVVLGCHIE